MNKELLWQWRGFLITTPLISILVIVLRSFGLLQPIELSIYDQFIRWKPEQEKDSAVVIVGIDEADVRKIGNPIFPDQVYANVIENLQSQQPRAIGLDIYRDQPVNPGHEKLVRVFETYDNVVGITKVVGDNDLETIPPPPTLEKKNQISFNDVVFDRDNRVRRALLALPSEKLYSFAMYLAILYLQEENVELETVGEDNWWKLGNSIFVPFQEDDGVYNNADDGGYQIILNYRGDQGHFERISLTDVLEDKMPQNWAKDKIVLIGFVGESFQDMLLTPYTRQPSERMPGVEFHANVVSQIISAGLNTETPEKIVIKTVSDDTETLIIILWAGIGAFLAWGMRKSDVDATGVIVLILSLVGAVIFLVVTSYYFLLSSWWLPLVSPLMAFSGSVISITAYVARSAGQIRDTFGRYLNDEIVNVLLESPEGVKLGGERKKITILTSDLRGFTATSESVSPEEVVKILNFYLGYMTDIIAKHEGIIDEFMGDGILVLFGAPISKKDDAQRAVACALEMQLAMESINKQMAAWNFSNLKMGIGINTGEVVVGNIGSEKRTKYGIVGSEVNLTYRIESYTIGGQILISETTLNEIQSNLIISETKKVSPKGVKEPLTIYSIVGIEGEYNLRLPEKVEDYVVLSQPIDIKYALLHEKDIGQEIYAAKIIKLSSQSAEVKINSPDSICPDSLKNIKITVNDVEEGQDVYAKVIKSDNEKQNFKITFTHLPIEISKKFKAVCNSK